MSDGDVSSTRHGEQGQASGGLQMLKTYLGPVPGGSYKKLSWLLDVDEMSRSSSSTDGTGGLQLLKTYYVPVPGGSVIERLVASSC